MGAARRVDKALDLPARSPALRDEGRAKPLSDLLVSYNRACKLHFQQRSLLPIKSDITHY